jgi:hypothetical protein
MFQVEEPIGIIEGFKRTGEFRGYNRWQHAFILSPLLRRGIYATIIDKQFDFTVACKRKEVT